MVDYWAGAKKACDEMDLRLPIYSEIESLKSSSGLNLKFGQFMLGSVHPQSSKNYQLGSHPTNALQTRNVQSPVLCISK